MDHQTADMAAIVKRLERVERQNRLWRCFSLLVILSLGVGVLAGGAEPPKDAVAASEFKLVDTHGKVRCRLFMTDFGHPALAMFDEDGKERANMHISKDGPRFACLDQRDGHTDAVLGTHEKGGYFNLRTADSTTSFSAGYDGVRVNRDFAVVDEKGRPRVVCGFSQLGEPGLSIAGTNGVNQVNLTLNAGGPALTCYDTAGKTMLMQVGAVPQGGFATGRNSDNDVLFGLNSKGLYVKK